MAVTEPTNITASLNYVVPPADGSRIYAAPTGTNLVRKEEIVQIENIRGKEDSVSLDTTGFQYFERPTTHKGFTDDESIKKDYYTESNGLLKELTGASKVVIFDHIVRQNNPELSGKKPAVLVHGDYTKKAAIARVHYHLPEEAEILLKKRFQIIHLWRPIEHAAYDHPLALCAYHSVDVENDILPVSLINPEFERETIALKYNPNHKWKYLRGMTPDEGVLIKCFDSKEGDNNAIFTPHSAFIDPTTPEGVQPRESIELTTLVFYD